MVGVKSIISGLLAATSLWASALAAPSSSKSVQPLEKRASPYWIANIERMGKSPFNAAPDTYKVFRNVVEFGADPSGARDSTEAIQRAISDGNRCGLGCGSSTTATAMVYFPPGTYRISKSVQMYYSTYMVGDALSPPILLADPSFEGMAVLDADPYQNDGKNWYINQNNFFRQVRNFVIDLRQMPPDRGAAIHWQVAQATSLHNIRFEMSNDPATKQIGIFMDNGSGGWMSDLTFNGGDIGAFFGSQQFTTRNMTFNGCKIGIVMHWNWLWTMQDIKFNNCGVGLDMSDNGPNNQEVGSVLVLDSVFTNTPVGIRTAYQPSASTTNGSLVIENTDFTGSAVAVQFGSRNEETAVRTLLPGGSMVARFHQGRVYDAPDTGKAVQTSGTAIARPQSLVTAGNKFFTKSRPQYENVDASKFVHVKRNSIANAAGDGKTDDTEAIRKIFAGVKPDEIVYFDHGSYIITDTVEVPPNIKIAGEAHPVIMAGGNSNFKDMNKPKPMFKVGNPGQKGSVEMSDLMIGVQGPQPGAVLMEWNLGQTDAGSNGLWDVHFRVGGHAGSQLQVDKCAKTPKSPVTPEMMLACAGAAMHLHITKEAAVYLENVWSWTADHELDMPGETQINIFNGRGIFSESEQGPVWMWGTASEHNVFTNFQISNSKNVFMGCIQTETPYFQGNPGATVPYTRLSQFNDPDFPKSCAGAGPGCNRSWGLRVINSKDILLYGAGLYSFFDNYGQDCVRNQNCQENMVSIESSSVDISLLATKASINMLTVDGKSAALDADNRNNFCALITHFSSKS